MTVQHLYTTARSKTANATRRGGGESSTRALVDCRHHKPPAYDLQACWIVQTRGAASSPSSRKHMLMAGTRKLHEAISRRDTTARPTARKQNCSKTVHSSYSTRTRPVSRQARELGHAQLTSCDKRSLTSLSAREKQTATRRVARYTSLPQICRA